MAFKLQWTIEGDTQLSRNLLIAADRVKDWGPAFKDTADYLRRLFSNEVFKTEGAIIDEHWSPLSKAYALRKLKKFPGKGLLEATGRMKDSFMSTWNATSAEVWNEAAYFKYHQSNQPRSKMPRRVMMKLANAQKQEVVRVFNTLFQRVIKGK